MNTPNPEQIVGKQVFSRRVGSEIWRITIEVEPDTSGIKPSEKSKSLVKAFMLETIKTFVRGKEGQRQQAFAYTPHFVVPVQNMQTGDGDLVIIASLEDDQLTSRIVKADDITFEVSMRYPHREKPPIGFGA